MISKVLWALDNEVGDREFERLCTDLLSREGYVDINPIGFKKDRGRDAEIRVWKGIDSAGVTTFFQYSLNRRWEEKLKKDLESVCKYGHEIDLFVFVTSQTVTGAKQDKLRDFVRKEYGCELRFYAREWFRHRLEENHQDLAKKYFNLDLPPTISHVEALLSNRADTSDYFRDVFTDISVEQTEANLILKLNTNPNDTQALHALSYVYYAQRHYKEALTTINKALRTTHDQLKNLNLRLAKSIIVAEYGIQEASKTLLIEAKKMMTELASLLKRDVDHYNLANVLSALGEYDEAESHYRESLEINPKAAHVWKNLGSLLCRVNRNDEELACYEKAIEIRPELVEAYLCKANTLLVHLNDAENAEALFKYAYELDPDLDNRWPHTTYWYSLCLFQIGKEQEALDKVNRSLEDLPNLSYLLQLKGKILSELWRRDEEYLDDVMQFFAFCVECDDTDYMSLHELIQILDIKNLHQEAWLLVERYLNWMPVDFERLRSRLNLDLPMIAQGLGHPKLYKKFRKAYDFTSYIVQAHEAGIVPDEDIHNILEAILSIPFTACLECLSMIKNRLEDDEADYNRAFTVVISYCAEYIPALGSCWATNLGSGSQNKKIDLISKGSIVLAEIVLVEASRQFGFCLSTLGINKENVPKLSDEIYDHIFADVATNFMFAACDDWGMVENGRLKSSE